MSSSRGSAARKARLGQYRASIGATVTRSFTAPASCRSSVISASAWSWVSATYSASRVSGHPSRTAAFHATFCRNAVPEQPDPQPAHVLKLPLGFLPGHLTAAHCLVQKREHLGAQQRRSQDLMSAADHGLVLSQADGDVRTDHVPGHGRSVPLSCRERLPQSTGMSGPLIGMRRETGWASGDARERPVFPARSAGLPWAVLGAGDVAVQSRPGSVPVVLPGRQARGVGPRARWPGRLALGVARRAARAVCRRRGCAAAASRSSSPGGVPADLAGCAAGISRCPRPGPGGMRYLARHLTIARLPPAGPPGVGMIPAQPSPAPSPPWPGSDGQLRAFPALSAWPGGAGAGGLPVSCGQPLVPTSLPGPSPAFGVR